MKVVSNGQFWLCTVALLILWIIVLTAALNREYRNSQKISLPPTHAEDDLKYSGICKNFCKSCDCLGFYCGEECICECNGDHTDTECIRKIQISAQSSNIPFEVLIQGPIANKFVRNALLYEQNEEKYLNKYHKKRATVTVYKPTKANSNLQNTSSCEKKSAVKEIFKAADKSQKRRKRASGNNKFEWFSNLGTNLLRPAPLGGRKRQAEVTSKPPTKATTVSSIFGNSWIFDSFDNTRNILTPRPLKKQKHPPASSESSEDIKLEAADPQASNEVKDDILEDRKIDRKESKADEANKKKLFLSDETGAEKPQENLLSSLYNRLFRPKLDSTNNGKSSLAAKENDQKEEEEEEAQEFPLYRDELSDIENDELDLFAEEEELEKDAPPKKKVRERKSSDLFKPTNIVNTSPKLPPINMKKGLQALFKPDKLLQKLRQVMQA